MSILKYVHMYIILLQEASCKMSGQVRVGLAHREFRTKPVGISFDVTKNWLSQFPFIYAVKRCFVPNIQILSSRELPSRF